MAFIICPDCKKRINEFSKYCDGCGKINLYYPRTLCINNVKIGDKLLMGQYAQSPDSNSKTDILWVILDIKEHKTNNGVSKKALLVSMYAIDSKKFNSKDTEKISWENSDIRAWLNNDFISNSFDDSEKNSLIEAITVSDCRYEKLPDSNKEILQTHEVSDKVFLLSSAEANRYFFSDEDRKCVPTDLALDKGCIINDGDQVYTINGKNGDTVWKMGLDGKCSCYWWLRTQGDTPYSAADVALSGTVNCCGFRVTEDGIGVRPAIWVDLNTIDWDKQNT